MFLQETSSLDSKVRVLLSRENEFEASSKQLITQYHWGGVIAVIWELSVMMIVVDDNKGDSSSACPSNVSA